MKKLIKIYMALFIVISSILCSCSCNNIDLAPVVTDIKETEIPDTIIFIDHITNSDYQKAIDYYNQYLKGNYILENEASVKIATIIEKIIYNILNENITTEDAKIQIKVISMVINGTGLDVYDYDNYLANFVAANESKKAFYTGKELEALQNYNDAISQYKKVIFGDSNYEEAQNSINNCVKTIKNECIEKAINYANQNQYLKAIDELESIKKAIPDDIEINSKIIAYENSYIDYIIGKAANSFNNAQTDYYTSLEIIKEGLNNYENNSALIEKKEYYESFAPQYLYDMEKLKGNANKKNEDTDRYGNLFTKCFTARATGNNYSTKSDVTYHLDGKYDKFTATIYGKSKSNLKSKSTVQIFADGNIIYQNLEIYDNTTENFSIELNILGIKEFRIVLKSQDGYAGIGITDMIIQKTKK